MSIDKNILETFENPVIWCESYLRDPRDKEKPLILRSYQKELIENSIKYQQMITQWGRRCLVKNSNILMFDGSIKKIEDITIGDSVCTFNNNQIKKGIIEKLFDNGIQDVYKVRLFDGREIECTDNHPFLISVGNKLFYKTIQDGLTVGNRCLVIKEYKKFGTYHNIDEAKLLGYLLTGGYINCESNQTPKFTSCNYDYILDVQQLIQKLFGYNGTIKKRKNANAYDIWLTNGNKGKKNRVKQWILENNLSGTKAKHKKILNYIKKYNSESLSYFINRIFSGDGCISLNIRKDRISFGKAIDINLTSCNLEFLKDFRSVLYKLGVNSKIKKELKKSPSSNKICLNYKLYFSDSYSIKNFLSFVGNVYGKEKNCIEALEELDKRYSTLIEKTDNNFYTSKISKIEYVGKKQTYDITVKRYHNFISDGIITHNSGKSVVMCADCLWWASVYPILRMIKNKEKNQKPFRILVFAPYESQVDELWNTFIQLIGDSPLLKDQIEKIRTSDTHLIQFKGTGNNKGSTIEGYTIGISSSNQGISLRGLCLAEDTRITMVNGITKNINNIQVGEKIIAFNEEINLFVEDEIELIADEQEKELFEILLQSGKKIKSSKDHKFLTDNGWKKLSEITLFDKIKTVDYIIKIGISSNKIDPLYDKIISIKSIGIKKCYDITTKKYHNFIANGIITHNSGDLIFIDEMDFIPTAIMEQILIPITTTHPDCRFRICSTPSGARELYYKYCTQAKERGWYHSHIPSWHVNNENWMSQQQALDLGLPITKSSEFQVKSVTSSDNYSREYGAEFGEEYGGVYKHHLIHKSLVKYGRNIDISDPLVFNPEFQQNVLHKYIIGVDWNSYINGGQIVVLEFCTTPTFVNYFDDDKNQEVTIDFTGRYRLFYRKSIKSKDATQRLTRQEIIRLLTYYKIDYLYVDYGAGDTNIEELTLYGRQHPELNLSQKLRVIDSGAVVEHYDHVIQKMVKKRNKSLMINFSVLSLEEGMFVLPKEEDTDTRLIGQMRNYIVKHVTARGEYAYEGEDHILDAFNLAVYGFQQNFGQLLTSRVTYQINLFPDPRAQMYPQRASTVNGPIPITKFKSNGTYNMPIRDPDKPIQVQSPRRGFLPGIGSRQNISQGFGRRKF